MRRLGAVLAVVCVGGCTTVRLTQRDGCWVRRTERWLGDAKEELGPCMRPQPPWSDDRLARLVQECEARADYRWHEREVAAWTRGEKLPEAPNENVTLQECMGEATRAMLAENEALRKQLADASADRDAVKARGEQERGELAARLETERKELGARLDADHKELWARMDEQRKDFRSMFDAQGANLRATSEKLADALGAAASRPQPAVTATATSTSEGRSTMEHAEEASTTTAASPPVTVVATAPPACPGGSKPATYRRAARNDRKAKPAVRSVDCEPAPSPPRSAQAAAAEALDAAVAAQAKPAAGGAAGAAAPADPPASPHAGEGGPAPGPQAGVRAPVEP